MRKPGSMHGLEELGRVRLSVNFYMRDCLYSEIASFYGIPNIPEDPDLAIEVGSRLCEELLEPLQATFGRIAIRSAYRAAVVTKFGNERGEGASVKSNSAYHVWDRPDENGFKGAAACIVIPWFADRYAGGADWRAIAWWVHDHLPYSHMEFYPKLCALNLQWHEKPVRRIDSFITPRGCLTKPEMQNHSEDHSNWYQDFPVLAAP